MKNVLKGLLLPSLVGIFFTLSLYSRNIDLIPFTHILIPLVIVASISSLFYFFFHIILRAGERASVVSLFLIAAIFSYGYSVYISITLGIITVLLITPLLNKYIKASTVSLFLIIAIGMVLVPSFSIIKYHWELARITPEIPQVEPPSYTPDIYYIIFDSYAGNESLAEMGYDNSDLTDFLVDRGFYVADESYCNYPRTYLSLASSLNMDYQEEDGEVIDYTKACYNIEHNKVAKLLKAYGYQYNHVGTSMWAPTLTNIYADKNYEYQPGNPIINEFSISLYETTLFCLRENLVGMWFSTKSEL